MEHLHHRRNTHQHAVDHKAAPGSAASNAMRMALGPGFAVAASSRLVSYIEHL